MITLSTLYEGYESFEAFIKNKNLNLDSHSFIRVYTTVLSPDESLEMIKDIRNIIPNSSLIGGSCNGIIFNGKQFENATLVMIEQFDNVDVKINVHNFKNKDTYTLAKQINNDIKNLNAPLMHILFSDFYTDISQFAEDFNAINTNTRLAGGVLGEILSKKLPSYAFTYDGIFNYSVVTASLISNDLNVFTDVNVAHEPISPVYTLNSCQDNMIVNIEDTCAIDWCKDQFGMEDLTDYTDWQAVVENDMLARFPLILEGYNSHNVTRFIKYDATNKHMCLYASKLTDNTPFRIGYVSPIKCVKEMYKICNHIKSTPIESLFLYSCLFRKVYLSNCADWEISAFRDKVCGAFMMGEIFSVNGKNQYLNGSCCFIGISESSNTYINVDFSVFDKLAKIQDDNEKLLNIVLRKQSSAITKQNKQLFENILVSHAKSEQDIYTDSNFGIDNSIKFLHEKSEKNFNKICMIQLENSELIMSRVGKETYFTLFKSVISSLSNFINNYSPYMNNYKLYTLNDNTIFLAIDKRVNDNKFTEFINEVYENFKFIKIPNRDELMIFRFAVVSNEDDLLGCGLETLQKCKSLQAYFLVYDDSSSNDTTFDNEMEIIHILNEAIKNKWVIPYFQGIYDNQLKTINKYEALMRIKDKDGKVYTPYYFMDIAKKFNLYPILSKMMVEQVFELFKNKKTNVSINLSAYDINSQAVQNAIFEQLEKIENRDNFIFEILEDENFRNMEMLKIFIDKARKYNVNVAIDDFGTGYSNFMEIAKIAPDFIKIDGSIIRNIDSDDMNKKVLNNIVFLGKQLETELIAEFVENESIQQVIEELEIRFSQGYYFAKPEPFENIKDNLK